MYTNTDTFSNLDVSELMFWISPGQHKARLGSSKISLEKKSELALCTF